MDARTHNCQLVYPNIAVTFLVYVNDKASGMCGHFLRGTDSGHSPFISARVSRIDVWKTGIEGIETNSFDLKLRLLNTDDRSRDLLLHHED